ncbi:hypothetical protein TNCV_4707571 [Trichonephila clavipes]|nr:hypothetical protein TNCV_4707571 [Trichonephila clavipes]
MVDPVLGSLTPQLVSVQSARRFYSFAFQIPGQQHRAKTLGFSSPLPQTISPPLFRALFSSFARSLFSPVSLVS